MRKITDESFSTTPEKRSEGMDETKIKKIQKRDRRNLHVYKSTNTNETSIIWVADDETLHSFPVAVEQDLGKPSRTEMHTVASYYEMKYDIRLRYPKMP